MLLICIRNSVATGEIMEFILQPWQFYFLILAGLVNRQQQQVIECLRAARNRSCYFLIAAFSAASAALSVLLAPTDDRRVCDSHASLLVASMIG